MNKYKDLESVKQMKKYVHDELIPGAEKNNQLICFMRSVDDWNITDEEKKNPAVYCYKAPGNGPSKPCVNVNTEWGKIIFEHYKRVTKEFSILL